MRDLTRVMKLAMATVLGALVLLASSRSEAKDTAKPAPTTTAPAPAAPTAGPAKPAAPAAAAKTVEIVVTEKGYEPSPIKLKKGEPVKLKVTRKTDETCATEIMVQGTDINVPLPLGKPVEVSFTPEKTGNLKFGCAMGMMISGVFLVE